MASPKASNPKKSARYYASNPEARAKKNAAQRKYNKSEKAKKYRSELWTERRKRGIAGKGGGDLSHTKKGGLVRESASKNRARNRGRK